jgi:hypothetical protein
MTTTIEDEIQSADDAFLSAISPKEINGITLEPFSLMRQAVALEIAGLNVETAFFEAVVRVWVCTLKPREALLARRDKDQAVIDAFEWAERSGFSFTNWQPLRDLYQQINDELRQSTNAVLDKQSSDPTPNSGGLQPS